MMRAILCDRRVLRGFLANQLEEDDRLEFLIHLDCCPTCWEAVYAATKAGHPQFYKRPPKGSKGADFGELQGENNQREKVRQEIFDVA